MSAGLPGAGLAGVFFVLSALLAVPLEAVRTVQGRSSRAAWMLVTRNAALALAMIAALQLFFMGISAIVRHVAEHAFPKTLPIAPVLMALAVLVIVLLTAKALELALRWRAALRASAD